jgi:hypothetical protein
MSGPEGGSGLPRRLAPENHVTARSINQTGYFQLIASPPQTVPVHNAALDVSGWEAAHD